MCYMHIYIIEKKYIHNLGKILYRFAQKKNVHVRVYYVHSYPNK